MMYSFEYNPEMRVLTQITDFCGKIPIGKFSMITQNTDSNKQTC